MKSPIDTRILKAEAARLGFSACGVAPAGLVGAEDAARFCRWIDQGHQGRMDYMANHREKRLDPTLLMEEAQSIVSVALNYAPRQLLDEERQYGFARYAYGQDYHDVMKARLTALSESLQQVTGQPFRARLFCDTAPLLERYWAWRCGLGWIGKNTQLIIPRAGSYFFLGEMLTDASFTAYDRPVKSRCGRCTRCLDHCPTHALSADKGLDASRCLSYLTIEYRGAELPPEAARAMGNCLYGCDRCQSACPWNTAFATPTEIAEFRPSDSFMQLTREEMEHLSVEDYRRIFKGSAVKRAKYEGLMRNLQALKGAGKEGK